MTAAIPPACCAGADDGKIHPQYCRLGRACGGDFAFADSGAGHLRIGAGSRRNDNNGGRDTDNRRDTCDWRISRERILSSAAPYIINKPVAQPIAFAKPVAFPFTNSFGVAIADTDANCYADLNTDTDRFELQRGIG